LSVSSQFDGLMIAFGDGERHPDGGRDYKADGMGVTPKK